MALYPCKNLHFPLVGRNIQNFRVREQEFGFFRLEEINFFLITMVFDLIIKLNIFLSLIRDLTNLFFISLKVGISFLLMSSENINIFPLEVKFFFDKRKIFFISLNWNKWIVCLIIIKSNFFLLFRKKSIFRWYHFRPPSYKNKCTNA